MSMNEQERRNLIADQFADQVQSAVNTNAIELIPESGPFAAAAARSIDVSHLPELYRQSAVELLRGFAKTYRVDRPQELDACE
jgi:23S rRNA A2030 N6-methylase RlmJ